MQSRTQNALRLLMELVASGGEPASRGGATNLVERPDPFDGPTFEVMQSEENSLSRLERGERQAQRGFDLGRVSGLRESKIRIVRVRGENEPRERPHGTFPNLATELRRRARRDRRDPRGESGTPAVVGDRRWRVARAEQERRQHDLRGVRDQMTVDAVDGALDRRPVASVEGGRRSRHGVRTRAGQPEVRGALERREAPFERVSRQVRNERGGVQREVGPGRMPPFYARGQLRLQPLLGPLTALGAALREDHRQRALYHRSRFAVLPIGYGPTIASTALHVTASSSVVWIPIRALIFPQIASIFDDVESCLGADLLAEFVEGLISAERIGLVESHLSECESCRRVLDAIAPQHEDGHLLISRSATLSEIAEGEVRDEALAATLPSHDVKPAPKTNLTRGDRVGRYEIERVLGSGAMGIVYAAYDPDIDRRVALKMIRFDSHDPNRRARMLREAQAMARVAHPDVITVHDVGTYQTAMFIAMELVVGGTLREWLGAESRSRHEILDVVLRAGAALAKAHAVGLVHRDFKPDNVLVGDDGRVRVTDFGLVRDVQNDDVATARPTSSRVNSGTVGGDLTKSGGLVGTPAYMSPEQLRGKRATVRSDIFSFSVTLWEALYRQRPYAAHTLTELEAKIRTGQVSPPATEDRGTDEIRAALLVGLAADPQARYGSMSDLMGAVDRARHSPRPSPARRAARVAAAFLALVAFTVGWVRVRGASKTAPLAMPVVVSVATTVSGDASPVSLSQATVTAPTSASSEEGAPAENDPLRLGGAGIRSSRVAPVSSMTPPSAPAPPRAVNPRSSPVSHASPASLSSAAAPSASARPGGVFESLPF